jgi:hypothetical protein
LPYAFHGKRIFSEIFAIENNLPHTTNEDLKAVAGSDAYKALVNEKIETSQRASSEISNCIQLQYLWHYCPHCRYLLMKVKILAERK